MVRLIRSFDLHADVICLLLRQHRQFRTDALQMQTRDFLIQVFGQYIDFVFVLLATREQFNLCQSLIGKRIAHHKRRVTCRTTEINQATFGQ